MSHNGIQEYTKDFNFLWKADFQVGELSSVGYENILVQYLDLYKASNSNYLETYFKVYSYLSLHSSISLFQLLLFIPYTDHYEAICEVLRNNEDNIIKLFSLDAELADSILQMYEVFEDVDCKFLIPHLSKHYKWIEEQGQEICNRDIKS